MSRRRIGPKPMTPTERKRAWRARALAEGRREVTLFLPAPAADRLRDDAKAAGVSMSDLVERTVAAGKTAEVAQMIVEEQDATQARSASSKAADLPSREDAQE